MFKVPIAELLNSYNTLMTIWKVYADENPSTMIQRAADRLLKDSDITSGEIDIVKYYYNTENYDMVPYCIRLYNSFSNGVIPEKDHHAVSKIHIYIAEDECKYPTFERLIQPSTDFEGVYILFINKDVFSLNLENSIKNMQYIRFYFSWIFRYITSSVAENYLGDYSNDFGDILSDIFMINNFPNYDLDKNADVSSTDFILETSKFKNFTFPQRYAKRIECARQFCSLYSNGEFSINSNDVNRIYSNYLSNLSYIKYKYTKDMYSKKEK